MTTKGGWWAWAWGSCATRSPVKGAASRLAVLGPVGPPLTGGRPLRLVAVRGCWRNLPREECGSVGGGGGGPAFCGAAGGEDPRAGRAAGVSERVECPVEVGGGLVAVEEVAQLGAGQPVGVAGQRGVDLFGERIAGRALECPGGGAGGVVP